MSKLPDFDKWAEIIRSYPPKDIAWNLKQIFELGREYEQQTQTNEMREWWSLQDNDSEWLYAHGAGPELSNADEE